MRAWASNIGCRTVIQLLYFLPWALVSQSWSSQPGPPNPPAESGALGFRALVAVWLNDVSPEGWRVGM